MYDKSIYKQIGLKVYEIRERKRIAFELANRGKKNPWTASSVQKSLNIATGTYSDLEAGYAKKPDLILVLKLISLFGNELITFINEELGEDIFNTKNPP